MVDDLEIEQPHLVARRAQRRGDELEPQRLEPQEDLGYISALGWTRSIFTGRPVPWPDTCPVAAVLVHWAVRSRSLPDGSGLPGNSQPDASGSAPRRAPLVAVLDCGRSAV